LESSINTAVKDQNIIKLSYILSTIEGFDIQLEEPGGLEVRNKLKDAEAIIRTEDHLKNLEFAIESKNLTNLNKQLHTLNTLANADQRTRKHPSWNHLKKRGYALQGRMEDLYDALKDIELKQVNSETLIRNRTGVHKIQFKDLESIANISQIKQIRRYLF